MIRATTDRSEIIHGLGFRHLSPALDARGQPAFSAAAGDGLTRCGWASFFRALDERKLALVFAEDAPPELVPAARAHPPANRLAGALRHASNFWAALVSKPPKPAP